MDMQADPVSALAGVALSLGFSYIPGLRKRFGRLDGTRKRLTMVGLCLLVVLIEFGLACGGLAGDFGLSVTCDRAGVISLAWALITAVMANQATYLVSPQKP